jgi:hypothetical protein
MKHSLVSIAMCGLLTMGTAAYAGPCNMKDAGSGPTPGANARSPTAPGENAGMPKDAARSEQHAPTGSVNKELGSRAASPKDVRDQTAGKPTAAELAEGKKAADC